MNKQFIEEISKMAEFEFDCLIEETDIIVFKSFNQGFKDYSIFYLYKENGELKDIQVGNPIPKELNKFKKPILQKQIESDIICE